MARPFAHFFEDEVRPIQDHVRDALLAGRFPAECGYGVDEAVTRLSAPGYDRMETGWTQTDRGHLLIACRTDMPGVTAEMWDWYFGWHGTETARYKLWHPGAHTFSAVGEDRSGNRTLTDRQRYVNNVSYVDEYVGAAMSRLAIRFIDPTRLGFEDVAATTHICALVGASDLPIATGWLVHQVRPTAEGCEMRSRFFLGDSAILDVPADSMSNAKGARALTSRVGRASLNRAVGSVVRRRFTGDQLGHDLLHHCASEMNHLAGFLARLFTECRDMP